MTTNEPPKLLDIATGTADVALLLAKSIPTASILGMDPSHNMLEIGRQKVTRQEKDAQIQLDFGAVQDFDTKLLEHQFDGATMAFGIRNVPAPREDALCQIHRVLKPNAVFCILEFSEPADDAGFLGYLARLFIRHIVPIVGGLLSGAPREYLHLQNSIQDFPSPPDFVKLMESLSCKSSSSSGSVDPGDQKSSSFGSFRVDELIQMNFGSVQLYVTTAITKEV
jgi:demethylmenaquinone methyltransferase/2-methoxy-6-polyprenyl-1,4-benzoquinol methylase